jgi:6,7-dimethyl-8-ribityllumazine synthase
VSIVRGEPLGADRRVAVVAARFNELVTTKLVDGARAGLAHHGVRADAVTVAWVPGAFEIPLVAQRFAASGRFDAVICLGAVIRGETSHFELVAAEAARGIADVGRSTGIPCIFEILATDTLDQAEARAGGIHGNKGWEAARAALEMASVLDRVDEVSEAGSG